MDERRYVFHDLDLLPSVAPLRVQKHVEFAQIPMENALLQHKTTSYKCSQHTSTRVGRCEANAALRSVSSGLANANRD